MSYLKVRVENHVNRSTLVMLIVIPIYATPPLPN